MESAFRDRVQPGTLLIETFRFCAATQLVIRAELHLQRLQASALALGIALDMAEVQAKLRAIDSAVTLRCRLTVSPDGRIDIKAAGMPITAQTEWTLQISDQRLASDDPWLRHKTTQRQLYDDTRANLPDGADEVIFLNERDEVCEGTITNVFLTTEAGEMLTPALSCGLLPGVLRQSLLNSGTARETVISLPMLKQARSLHVGNSLRGLIPGRLIDRPSW